MAGEYALVKVPTQSARSFVEATTVVQYVLRDLRIMEDFESANQALHPRTCLRPVGPSSIVSNVRRRLFKEHNRLAMTCRNGPDDPICIFLRERIAMYDEQLPVLDGASPRPVPALTSVSLNLNASLQQVRQR
jgi:hypothetical protein